MTNKILGYSAITTNRRVTIPPRVAQIAGVGDTDTVVFVQDDSGNIIVKKAVA